MKYVSHEKSGDDYILTVEWADEDKPQSKVIGSGTVWRRFPSFERMDPFWEKEFADIYSKIRYEERTPAA